MLLLCGGEIDRWMTEALDGYSARRARWQAMVPVNFGAC